MSEEEHVKTPSAESEYTNARNVRHVSTEELSKYLGNVTVEIERIEKCLMYFDFAKTNAAEMSKLLVIINDIHRCNQNIRETSEQLLHGDIVVDK